MQLFVLRNLATRRGWPAFSRAAGQILAKIELRKIPGEWDGRHYIVLRNGAFAALVYRLDDGDDSPEVWALTGEGPLLASLAGFSNVRDALVFIDEQLSLAEDAPTLA